MPPFVVFDLDDTLVDYAGAIDLAFGAFVTERALAADGLDFLREVNTRQITVMESWQVIGTHFGLDETAEELALAFAAMVPAQTVPYVGAAAGLAALREAGWRTALLSNGIEHEQRVKMRDNMADLFDAMRFCDESGPRKPDPVVFAEVARLAGAELDGAWMVGDSLTSDIAGGLAVGMTTIWISRGRPVPEDGPHPHHVVHDVAEAFALLSAVREQDTADGPATRA